MMSKLSHPKHYNVLQDVMNTTRHKRYKSICKECCKHFLAFIKFNISSRNGIKQLYIILQSPIKYRYCSIGKHRHKHWDYLPANTDTNTRIIYRQTPTQTLGLSTGKHRHKHWDYLPANTDTNTGIIYRCSEMLLCFFHVVFSLDHAGNCTKQ